MYPFEITKPLTVEGAVEALRNEEAQPLAGGQTLIPTLRARLAMPEVLVSLSGIAALQSIAVRDGQLCIGAGVTHATVARECGRYPALAALAADIGDPAVRRAQLTRMLADPKIERFVENFTGSGSTCATSSSPRRTRSSIPSSTNC